MKLVLDSNIFVSSLDPDDIFHHECFPVFERILAFEIEAFCPALVLAESVCALYRRTQSVEAAWQAYRHLVALPSLHWLNITVLEARHASLLAIKTGLKANDSLILQASFQLGFPLLTKDKEIRRRAPKELRIIEPFELAI